MSFLDDKSQTSAALIICRLATHPVSPPHPTLVALLAMRVGDPTEVSSSSLLPMVINPEEQTQGEIVGDAPK
jgi:hypothetical protein